MKASNTGSNMRRVVPILILALAAVTVPAAAGDSLPPSFRAWTDPNGSKRVAAESLEQVAGPNAAVLREYGVLGVEERVYSRGNARLTARLYRMSDASGAFGAYTYLLTEAMAPADLSRYASVSAHRVLAVVGSQVLEVTGNVGQSSPGDLKALVTQLTPAKGQHLYPTIGEYFPKQGRIRNSERYVVGPQALNALLPLGNDDWLGFGNGAEAQLSRYRAGGKELTMLLAVYPTPQVAAQKLEELGKRFVVNPQGEASTGSAVPLFARRKGSLLAMVLSTDSPQTANELLEQIHYETQVTWNEPNHSLKDPSIGEIIVGTLLGTGVFLILALAVSMGFGGVRLLVKKLLPGKVFDRTEQLEILQLGLSSKPIEVKDFYRF